MGLTQFVVEIYTGNQLSNRQQLILPVIMAIQQAMDICQECSQYQQPIRVVFINEDGGILEYKNKGFQNFEGGM